MLVNTISGVRAVDHVAIDVARTLCVGRLRTALRVVLPASMPYILAGMRVSLALALIDDPAVVRRILEHLGRWAPEPAERGPPGEAPDWPRNAVIPITHHPVPDIA